MTLGSAPDAPAQDGPLDPGAAAIERAQRRDRLILFVAVVIAVLGLGLFLRHLAFFIPTNAWGFDLDAYLDAARRLARGDLALPGGSIYDADALVGPFRPGPYKLFLYSPPFAAAMLPLTAISIDSARVAWYVGRLVLFGVACAVMPVRPSIRFLTFAIAALTNPVIGDMNLGNVSVLVTSLLAITWRWLDRITGCVALALAMTVRPILGLVLIWSLLRRRWWPVLWTVVAGIVIVLLSLPFVGIQTYQDYFTVLRNVYDVTGQDNNRDVGSLVLRVGGGPLLASIALYAGFAVAVGAMLLSLRYDRQTGFMVTIGATLLLSPLLWDHYLTTLLLTGAFLAHRGQWWGLALPLLAWVTGPMTPLLALGATVLPFLVRRPREDASTSTGDEPGFTERVDAAMGSVAGA
ncbi:MAG: glycosyltransferase family 87 protein [Candidatus Limnocylindrales bacterium]